MDGLLKQTSQEAEIQSAGSQASDVARFNPSTPPSLIGYVTMGMAVAPMIAPTLGGVLDTYFGWRASFAFLIVFGGSALLFAYWQLHETNHSCGSADSAHELLRRYGSLFRSRLFWGY